MREPSGQRRHQSPHLERYHRFRQGSTRFVRSWGRCGKAGVVAQVAPNPSTAAGQETLDTIHHELQVVVPGPLLGVGEHLGLSGLPVDGEALLHQHPVAAPGVHDRHLQLEARVVDPGSAM